MPSTSDSLPLTTEDRESLNLINNQWADVTAMRAVEWVRCRSNPLYFILNYVYLPEIGGSRTSLKYNEELLHPKFRRAVRCLYRYHNVILMASRQLGKSTIAACMIAWAMNFFPNNRVAIMNMQKRYAQENLNRIKFILSALPEWMRIRPTSRSEIKEYLTLANGSRCDTYYPSASTPPENIARSLTIPIIYIDEAAFIRHIDTIYAAAQPTISKAREQAEKNRYPHFIFITSTPFNTDGLGKFFFDMWSNAIDSDLLFEPAPDGTEKWLENRELLRSYLADPEKNSFIRIKYHWSEDPTKDQEWYERQRREPETRLIISSRIGRLLSALVQGLPDQVSRQLCGPAQGLIPQVGIALGHGRAFVRQQLLQGIEVHLAGGGQHGSIGVPQAVQGPEVLGQTGRILDPVHLLVDVGALSSAPAREDKRALRPGMVCQNLSGRLVQGNLLVHPAFGVANMNEAPLKVDVIPLQPEQFAAPHAGEQGQAQEVGRLDVGGPVDRFQECGQLFRGQVLRLEVVYLGHLDSEGRDRAQMLFGCEVDKPPKEFQDVPDGARLVALQEFKAEAVHVKGGQRLGFAVAKEGPEMFLVAVLVCPQALEPRLLKLVFLPQAVKGPLVHLRLFASQFRLPHLPAGGRLSAHAFRPEAGGPGRGHVILELPPCFLFNQLAVLAVADVVNLLLFACGRAGGPDKENAGIICPNSR